MLISLNKLRKLINWEQKGNFKYNHRKLSITLIIGREVDRSYNSRDKSDGQVV